MEYSGDKIVKGRQGIKYSNIYVIKGDIAELHITDGASVDNVIIVDTDMVIELKEYYWACTFVGKEGHKSPRVFYHVGHSEIFPLNRFILEYTGDNKIIFRNRNQYDFRKSNLLVYEDCNVEARETNRYGVANMNSIYERKRNGNFYAYMVRYKENGVFKTKMFSIGKYKTKENTLKAAMLFRKQSCSAKHSDI